MGQNWNWYNITKMQIQSPYSYGKMGEWIFDDDLAELRVLLGEIPDLPHPLKGKAIPGVLICST